MKKYIIRIDEVSEAKKIIVEKANLNILEYGIEFNADIEGSNKKFIIPWHQVKSIEEINT